MFVLRLALVEKMTQGTGPRPLGPERVHDLSTLVLGVKESLLKKTLGISECGRICLWEPSGCVYILVFRTGLNPRSVSHHGLDKQEGGRLGLSRRGLGGDI